MRRLLLGLLAAGLVWPAGAGAHSIWLDGERQAGVVAREKAQQGYPCSSPFVVCPDRSTDVFYYATLPAAHEIWFNVRVNPFPGAPFWKCIVTWHGGDGRIRGELALFGTCG